MLLTSTVSQAINDVAFMTKALETAGRVDTEVVAGPIKGALVDICTDKKKRRYLTKKERSNHQSFQFSNWTIKCYHKMFWRIGAAVIVVIVCHDWQWFKRHHNNKKNTLASEVRTVIDSCRYAVFHFAALK